MCTKAPLAVAVILVSPWCEGAGVLVWGLTVPVRIGLRQEETPLLVADVTACEVPFLQESNAVL